MGVQLAERDAPTLTFLLVCALCRIICPAPGEVQGVQHPTTPCPCSQQAQQQGPSPPPHHASPHPPWAVGAERWLPALSLPPSPPSLPPYAPRTLSFPSPPSPSQLPHLIHPRQCRTVSISVAPPLSQLPPPLLSSPPPAPPPHSSPRPLLPSPPSPRPHLIHPGQGVQHPGILLHNVHQTSVNDVLPPSLHEGCKIQRITCTSCTLSTCACHIKHSIVRTLVWSQQHCRHGRWNDRALGRISEINGAEGDAEGKRTGCWVCAAHSYPAIACADPPPSPFTFPASPSCPPSRSHPG